MLSPHAATIIAHADEDDSGFGDEDGRGDIDWSSVFSMSSTTSGFEVTSATAAAAAAAAHHISSPASASDSYLCDSSGGASDPSLFSGSDANCEFGGGELLHSSWKSSSWTTDTSDFAGVRWKSELGDELEGFVHILVGS